MATRFNGNQNPMIARQRPRELLGGHGTLEHKAVPSSDQVSLVPSMRSAISSYPSSLACLAAVPQCTFCEKSWPVEHRNFKNRWTTVCLFRTRRPKGKGVESVSCPHKTESGGGQPRARFSLPWVTAHVRFLAASPEAPRPRAFICNNVGVRSWRSVGAISEKL